MGSEPGGKQNVREGARGRARGLRMGHLPRCRLGDRQLPPTLEALCLQGHGSVHGDWSSWLFITHMNFTSNIFECFLRPCVFETGQ